MELCATTPIRNANALVGSAAKLFNAHPQENPPPFFDVSWRWMSSFGIWFGVLSRGGSSQGGMLNGTIYLPA